MTKSVRVSDALYELLKGIKDDNNETFSEIIIRLCHKVDDFKKENKIV